MNPCLLIPIYDHGATIGAVVRSLESCGLPLLIIDDGSGESTRRELARLARDHAWLSVERLPRNSGRGAALRAGYRLAARRGMSHCIQLDADGQHDAADVPRFLEAAKANPEALILGAPRFDASAPKSRLYGRKLSQGLVWLQTLSFAIQDPLCGFRCFPLAPTLALLERDELGDRMDFDPEIAVRLVWAGVPVVNLPTRVVYHAGGLSHFQMVRDNARLVAMHARLLAGGALRAPRRLGLRLWGAR